MPRKGKECNEENFKKEVDHLYNGEIEIVGRFKGLRRPLLVKDKYGILQLAKATQLLKAKPSIKAALNPTTYFMAELAEKYPEIAEQITPVSEYVAAKEKMLFDTQYGLVSASPDALLAGHAPNVRSAIDRKDYVYKQLRYIYQDTDLDFKVTSTDRHGGRCTVICPIHGETEVQLDNLFVGNGCPKCNKGYKDTNVLYLIRLYDDTESFFKLGITKKMKNGDLQRFRQYRSLGYQIETLKITEFQSAEDCRNKETKLKRLIKNNSYTPKR